jgi:hypothetical protein
MDKERQRRSEAGRKGGLASGVQRQTNGASTTVERSFNQRSNAIEPRREEKRREEKSRERAHGLTPLKELMPGVAERLVS